MKQVRFQLYNLLLDLIGDSEAHIEGPEEDVFTSTEDALNLSLD